MHTRDFDDEDGVSWNAFAGDAVVAHGKEGAVLAFRPKNAAPGETVRTTVTFNSMPAADLALRTMGDRELRRCLSLARIAAGGA